MKLLVQSAQGLSGIHEEEEEEEKKGEEDKGEEKEGSTSIRQGSLSGSGNFYFHSDLCEKHLQTPTWLPRQYVPV